MQLDRQQQAAVQAVDGPVLLLAVPGSGKTTTLVARLGYLVYGCHVPARSILTTTYTVAATNELRTRFAAMFGQADAKLLEFRTINGVCARIIRAYERQGHKAFELVTAEDRLTALLAQIWRDIQQDFPTEADLRALRIQITCIKNQMLQEDELAAMETDPRNTLRIVPIYRAYCKAMRQNRWMDYDDQMVYALAILRRNPEILAQFQRQYRYFCVDEAQDTSRIQHTILRLLAGSSRNLFMVGDEDKSIYGFRAACPQALLEFE
ncbi:MAG: ATP-dependent helicase, partial [Gemmiger sp.]